MVNRQNEKLVSEDENVTRAYLDGRNDVRRELTAHIRQELLAWAENNRYVHYADKAMSEYPHWLSLEEFRAALDRIIPESKGKEENNL